MTKEELWQEFIHVSDVNQFDWFWSKLEEKDKEIETLRMKLCACGVAALSNTETTIKQRLTRDNPYWSGDLDFVHDAVDREMELRIKLKAADEVIEPFEKLANECLHNSLLHKDQTVYAYNKAEITMEDLRRVEHYKSLKP